MGIVELERQLRLFNLPPLPGGAAWQDRLYFALRPGFSTAQRMTAVGEQLIAAHGLSGRPRPRDSLHVSVLGVSYYHQLAGDERGIVEAAAERLAVAPFRLTFLRAKSYLRKRGPYPLVLVAEEQDVVTRLAGQLAAAMIRRGFRPRGQLGGEAHLTLLYDHHPVPEIALEAPINMEVSGLFLVRSHHGQSRHENQMFAFRS